MRNAMQTPQELLPLIEGYITRKVQDVEQMKELFEQRNYNEIARVAHKIKGTASSYGFPELGLSAKTIEEFAKIEAEESLLEELENITEIVAALR